MEARRLTTRYSLIIATKNKGKVKEFKEILNDVPVEVMSLYDLPECPEIVEDGDSFRQNAVKKAETISSFMGKIVVADDSGLEVDYLDGRPGIHSARFAGSKATDEENNQKLLKMLEDVPEKLRTAQFTCVIAISCPGKKTLVVEGICRGKIIDMPRGMMGFGYDPLFLVPELGKTFAELGPEIKNKISHRARAMEKAREVLRTLI